MRPCSGRWPALTWLSLLASGCTDFPKISSDECGNGVIEAPEDCDTFGLGSGTVCRPKGTVDACHFDCAAHDGVRAPCPAGWGCDTDGTCRQPTGDFEPPTGPEDVGAWTLATGDFDGDGRGDIMSLEPLDSVGATRLRFDYFDQQAKLEATRDFPKLLIAPVIKTLPGDQRSDIVFSASGLGVLLGRQDRSFVAETFSSFRVPNSSVRMVGVLDRRVAGISPILPLVGLATGTGFYVPDTVTGQLTLRAPFAGTIANLAGDPVSGNLFEDPEHSPCFEAVLAERGASHFTVVNVCDTNAAGNIVWRDPLEQQDIELEPRAAIDAGPLLADLNGDGHLDVLVGAGGKPYASYGDGARLANAVPYHLPFPNADGSFDIPMPLAASDVSGDGVPDFVFSDQLIVSSQSDSVSSRYSAGQVNRLGAPWTAAKIADFNGDGQLDIVASARGALDLEFFNGNGNGNLTASTISTDAPVEFLATGDFDGDRVTDLALLEVARPGQTKNSLSIAFGAAHGPPAPPVTLAQLTGPEQLASYDEGGIGNVMVTGQETVAGTPNGALTLLNGSGDRIPFAGYTLSQFSSNASIQDAFAIAVAVGNFSGQGQEDVLAVAISGNQTHQLWLAPAIESPDSVPVRLADFAPELAPAVLGPVDFTADIGSASADLDRDGRDEAIFAMPAGPERAQCGILVVGAPASSSSLLAPRAPLLLDPTCPDPQLQAADIDGDGFPDLALLTGTDQAADRQLLVLWNDGQGGFSSANVTAVASSAESPRGFTVLPAAAAQPPRPLGIAYVTKDSAWLRTVVDHSRAFGAPSALSALPGGTGIVASDVNGDGLVDLVLAASGNLSVLRARLKVP